VTRPTHVVVVGAGGLGREVAEMVEAAATEGGPILRGFLDDDRSAATWDLPAPLLGPIDSSALRVGDVVVAAVGEPRARMQVTERLGRGVAWHTVVHPTAVVSPRAYIGSGCVIGPLSYVGPKAHVGSHVVINVLASIGHDARAGALAVISPYGTLNGNAVIGEGVFMGTGAVVTIGRRVGAWSKVAAGAVVMRDVPECSLAMGNPARSRVMYGVPVTTDSPSR
jgi:sugar O-acyltransferase (sialic acid O-acetyltransferase NeuD family)